MHNSPSPPPGPTVDSLDDPSSLPWDWSHFLDFNLDDHIYLPIQSHSQQPLTDSQQTLTEPQQTLTESQQPLTHSQQPVTDLLYPPVNTSTSNNNHDNNNNNNINVNNKIRKRDPRMACSNFLAGRIPCACPELDAQLAAEEEEGAPGKKRTRTVGICRCQVPGCETDISELKGYHKRHRVCLRCANASAVVVDGERKRYCQQCGKFHVLVDFDEGKRSCRRKLERHNNRRRRKPTDSKGPGPQSAADYDDGCDEAGKDGKSMSSEAAVVEKLSLVGEGPSSSSFNAQNIHSDSIPSVAASGETQTDEEKEKGTQSPFNCDDKTAFSSMCTTGRISFKLYDWNPAEFPRRLRHQIFQWLANMPVELEGYIRPGCTILTIFIAMPRFMWVKLSEDPVVCIHDLLASPRNLLSGRHTFFVNLNNTVFSVMKGGRSVIKIKAVEKSPKLHYVQPACFEAGKPIEFLACGSNLLQPGLRFLVSFAGKYMKDDARVSICNQSATSTTNLDHQFLSIRAPRTELNVFGPGFIEVENESGLSNFIPILVAEEEICSEIKIMQMKYYSNLHSIDSEPSSCEVAVNKFSEVLVDMAWLLKQPIVEDTDFAIMSSQLQRFTFLLNFLIEYESTTVLKHVLRCMKMRIIRSGGMSESDKILLQEIMNHATDFVNQRLEKQVNFGSHSNDILSEDENCGDVVHPFISTVNLVPPSGHENEKTGLLNADCVMSVTPYKEQRARPVNMLSCKTNRIFTPRLLILAVALVTVCFGICAVALHPQKATILAITIRRCLFNEN